MEKHLTCAFPKSTLISYEDFNIFIIKALTRNTYEHKYFLEKQSQMSLYFLDIPIAYKQSISIHTYMCRKIIFVCFNFPFCNAHIFDTWTLTIRWILLPAKLRLYMWQISPTLLRQGH